MCFQPLLVGAAHFGEHLKLCGFPGVEEAQSRRTECWSQWHFPVTVKTFSESEVLPLSTGATMTCKEAMNLKAELETALQG